MHNFQALLKEQNKTKQKTKNKQINKQKYKISCWCLLQKLCKYDQLHTERSLLPKYLHTHQQQWVVEHVHMSIMRVKYVCMPIFV